MTSEGLFFVGFLFGFFFCLILIYIVRREMEQVAEGERCCIETKKNEKDTK